MPNLHAVTASMYLEGYLVRCRVPHSHEQSGKSGTPLVACLPSKCLTFSSIPPMLHIS